MTEKLIYNSEISRRFSEALLGWFAAEKRPLPFRQTKDPYHIWISEIMAQQTQIDTLIPYYHRFVKMFPNVTALAAAPEAQVLKLWEGLGYYSRAKNLHRAAKMICEDYGGQFPQDYEALLKLPGVGPYTGGAIASIAFNARVPAIDGNVLRVVSRFNDYHGDIAEDKVKKIITDWVRRSLPEAAGDFNESLMELGALICTPKSPRCMLCPVRPFCQSYARGTCETLPVKSKKIRQKRLKMEVGILMSQDKIFLVKRPAEGLLAGLWSFPIIEAHKNSPGEAIRSALSEYFPGISAGELIGQDKHVFTHIVWEMTVYKFKLPEGRVSEMPEPYSAEACRFMDRREVAAVALPVAFSKLLKLL